MVKMITRLLLIKLLLPNLSKIVAGYVADFLQDRHEARLARQEKFTAWLAQRNGNADGDERPSECPPCPACPAGDDMMRGANPASRVWFALSGLLLGGAVGLAGYLFLRDSQA